MRVAWAQLTQIDKMALVTGLKDGELDKTTIYFDFDEDAEHDRFWKTELACLSTSILHRAWHLPFEQISACLIEIPREMEWPDSNQRLRQQWEVTPHTPPQCQINHHEPTILQL